MSTDKDFMLDSKEILIAFKMYVQNPSMPSGWKEILFVCDAVLKTARAAFEGRSNFSTVREVCLMFDLLVLERTMDVTSRLNWKQLDHACETAWPWREILTSAVAYNPNEYFDDPATLRDCFVREADYYNYLANADSRANIEDLYSRQPLIRFAF